MLARRFTIVCLLITVFGMGLSVLVADRTMRMPTHGTLFIGCDSATGVGCLAQQRR